MTEAPESGTALSEAKEGNKETLEEDNREEDDSNWKSEESKEDEEEEEGECPFCVFMKGGECRDTFIQWEECVKEGEENKEDVVEKCVNTTSALLDCMKAHPDYYGLVLEAQKSVEEELDQRKEKEEEEDKDASESSSNTVDPGNLKEVVN